MTDNKNRELQGCETTQNLKNDLVGRKWPFPVDPARSAIMAKVKSANTKPEIKVRRELHRNGLRFRLHKKNMPGKPDIVLSSRKAVVFVHGCFWHRHEGCRRTSTPMTNAEFWIAKFERNVKRDHFVQEQLTKDGWHVFIVWECQTNDKIEMAKLIIKIKDLTKLS